MHLLDGSYARYIGVVRLRTHFQNRWMRVDHHFLRSKIALLIVLLPILSACFVDSVSGREHPLPEFFVRDSPPALSIALDPADLPEDQRRAGREGDLIEALSLGVLDGDWEREFGAIARVVQNQPNDRILVLERMSREIRIFSGDGQFVGVAGGRGGGPGEFRRPVAMSSLDGDGVLVFESSGRVSRFKPTPQGLDYSDRVELGTNVSDACTLGNRLYVHGRSFDDPFVIRVFSSEGEALSMFAEVYRSPNALVNNQLSRGRIACLRNPGIVLFAPAHLPEVRAYSLEGELMWWHSIEGLLPPGIAETPSGTGSSMWVPDVGYHQTVTLVPSEDEPAVLLQIAHIRDDADESSARVVGMQTIRLTADGQSWSHWGDEWKTIHEWSSKHFVLANEEPYPEVSIFRRP